MRPGTMAAIETPVAQPPTAPPQSQDGGGEGDLREPQYALFLAVYGLAVGGFLAWRARTHELPERVSLGDLALLGVATHKGSRLLAKDKVAAPIRRPFADYEDAGGPGEVEESPRGSGLRHAIGELIVCPFCLSQWVATALVAGLVVAPRTTRFVASVLTAVTASDFLQIAYKASEERL